MPTREEITYILVHDRMPTHDKIAPRSDGAFRLLIEAWCIASVTGNNGKITARVWNGMGTARSRKELTEARLIDTIDGGVTVHDYLDIQRSQAEIEKSKAAKSEAGKLGNHRRHHVNQHKVDPTCPYCLKGVA